ncbi:MAG: SprT family zinc-dependent metalloprotease [Aliivibrio sp.]|uniref:SprT family zinc-dependent metalloprotease n=1 Tax=Aliivibrio sp. TaxID=1872443 RepID=UPI001A5282C3|nr:SprT family zinc-dependent metalloprotease [Aliivibrio sp.]
MEQLKQLSIEKAAQCIKRAQSILNMEFELPVISFNQRGKIAGTARLQSWEVRLNPILLQENQQPFIDEVIPHEIAHLITFKLYGRVKPHGKEWQGVMNQLFNLPAKTTHSFNISSLQGKTFDYQCSCQTHHLTVRRHNRVVRQQARYLCQRCKQPLSPLPI